METNVEICYKKDRKKDYCLYLILGIIAIVLSFFIGVLVAGLTGIFAALGLGAIVALIIALAVLLIVGVIAIICCKKDDKKKFCC